MGRVDDADQGELDPFQSLSSAIWQAFPLPRVPRTMARSEEGGHK
jgi:hypothetical protein